MTTAVACVLTAGWIIPFAALSRPGQQLLEHEYWLAPLRRALGRPSLNATEAQVTYGAAILSFVGAPHWGFALGGGAIAGATSSAAVNAARLCWGVVPSLLAWPCASCPAPLSLDALSAGLTLAFCVDGAFAACKLAPPNYLWLRAPPTIAAVLSLQSHHRLRPDTSTG